jgi:hypothetical protein
MSQREKCAQLLARVPEYKLGYVVAYLQGLTADESADDRFCEALVDQYEADPDKGHYISFEDACKELSVPQIG